MNLLEDTAIFAVVVQQGGFSHAARHLGLSNGLISRRIANLEKHLGVSLLKRTTRQIKLTSEGEVLFKHAQRIQQELNSAICLIQSAVKKPRGLIRLSSPVYFGRHYLTPIIQKFMSNYPDINVELLLTGEKLDPIKQGLDFVIRGAGFIHEPKLQDSGLKSRLLIRERIGLYASPKYLYEKGEPKIPSDLTEHAFINYIDSKKINQKVTLKYTVNRHETHISLVAKFNCNDVETNLMTCALGYGIAKFTDLNAKNALEQRHLQPILIDYDWGSYNLYAIYPQQEAMPTRTRLLLEFVASSLSYLR